MKMAKLSTGILAIAITMTTGAAFSTQAEAQNPDAIDNARSVAKSLQQKQTNDTNAALDAAGIANPGKPAAGAPAPAVRPAVIPVSKPASPAAASPAKSSAVKAASNSGSHNQLQHINVTPAGDKIQIEISSSGSVTPKVSKLGSPARILVELPDTVVTTAQTKIAVGSGGVKGLRVGMDGKTPPTTSVVVDLEKALTYESATVADGKFILTVHGGEAVSTTTAKNTSAPGKTASVKPAAPAAKAAVAKVATPKPAYKSGKQDSKQAKAAIPAKSAPAKSTVVTVSKDKESATKADATEQATADDKKPEEKKPEDKKWAMNGKRDPFFSPVVQQSGSGCATGKKCLEIGAINLRGVVKSDSGFIAVVTNNLNKAYFLRENDPVFNGYVMKITGDSVTFEETVQDKLGKSFTREVVKRLFTPAV